MVGVRRRKGGGNGAEVRREDRAESRRGKRGRARFAEVGKANGDAV